jgi:hypothetical protein
VQAEVSVCTALASVIHRQRVKAKPWRALRGLDPGTTAPGHPSLAAKKGGGLHLGSHARAWGRMRLYAKFLQTQGAHLLHLAANPHRA